MGDTQGTEGQQQPGEQAGQQQESAFTPPASQADLDRIIQDRVARERNKFADYDTLKAKATEYDQFKESSKTEQQKAIDAAKAEGANEVTGKFTTRIVNAEIKATAASLDFSDPKDAIALFGDISTVEIGDDGPDAKAIKDRLEAIAKDKPYLLKTTGGPAVRQRPKPKQGSESTETKPAGKSRAAAALREYRGGQ
ncbi:hypothetical protein [Arthrobacter agilis]|uniref:hypothetical protein n=1 Tax=Arthrobacter agilis TaxID=37921 RepID=UPI002780DFBA|nr:hypothetical protein [Arthrobacter agilis]MDQ0735325.1 hypothetical protein [Arthrobacter agilis]